MIDRPPRIFISSTIHDFRDLRTALRYWFEDFGFEVFMSDYTDFPQNPGTNSYDSCLQVIDSCDYFMLLIGGRVGGWFDESQRVSITQMEYRHAYEKAKEGRIQLLSFVRGEIWTVREDRKGLRNLLKNDPFFKSTLSPDHVKQITHHGSTHIDDAAFIFDFINEVARIDEMKKSASSGTDRPLGNWIYPFSSFRDIVDACRSVLNIHGPLRRKALATNLLFELEQNLGQFVNLTDGKVVPATRFAAWADQYHEGGMMDKSKMKGKYLRWLGVFLVANGNLGIRLSTTVLNEAVISGEFLEYDTLTGSHVVGPLQSALINLQNQIVAIRNAQSGDLFKAASELIFNLEYARNPERDCVVENKDLIAPLMLLVGIKNSLNLSIAIHRALRGDFSRLGNVRSMIKIPFLEHDDVLTPAATREQIVAWIDLPPDQQV